MYTYPVTVRRVGFRLLMEFDSLDNAIAQTDRLDDVEAAALEFVAATTGGPMTTIALAIRWGTPPPNRLRSVHSQLLLRRYAVGPIEVVNGAWTRSRPAPAVPRSSGFGSPTSGTTNPIVTHGLRSTCGGRRTTPATPARGRSLPANSPTRSCGPSSPTTAADRPQRSECRWYERY